MSSQDHPDVGMDGVRLRGIAERCAGDDVYEIAGGLLPSFLWLHGSTLVELALRADGSVDFQAVLVLRPVRTSEIDPSLERSNRGLALGEVIVDDEGDVVFRHRIPSGSGRMATEGDVAELCRIADRLDDELHGVLGGERSYDRFRSDVLDALAGGGAVGELPPDPTLN